MEPQYYANPPSNSSAPLGAENRVNGRILIVDDDYWVRRTLQITLSEHGFLVTESSSGEEALALARAIQYDCALLDINMPGQDGIEVCIELRNLRPRLAILMLTVRNSQDDRIAALEAGADDYVVKPFQTRELIARIRAAVRRVHAPVQPDTIIQVGEISLSIERRLVLKSGKAILLTPKEFDVLQCLMNQPGAVVPYRRLLSSVWGPEFTSQVDYLRTVVHQLRTKLEDNPRQPEYVLTQHYVGYRFADPKRPAGSDQEVLLPGTPEGHGGMAG